MLALDLGWGGVNPSLRVCFFEILSSGRLIRFLEASFDCLSFLVFQIDLMRESNVFFRGRGLGLLFRECAWGVE